MSFFGVILLGHSPGTLPWTWGSSLHRLAWLASEVWGSACLCLSRAGIANACHHTQLLTWAQGITSDSGPCSHFPLPSCPYYFFYFLCLLMCILCYLRDKMPLPARGSRSPAESSITPSSCSARLAGYGSVRVCVEPTENPDIRNV